MAQQTFRAITEPRNPLRPLDHRDPIGDFATHQVWCSDVNGEKARNRAEARRRRDAAVRAARTRTTGTADR